ncbi:hypothetical protein SESBI_44303 [Sesbania bispinosa]|nr:hypothetical protein SESBI_44303 [Sesbania bispinosa]
MQPTFHSEQPLPLCVHSHSPHLETKPKHSPLEPPPGCSPGLSCKPNHHHPLSFYLCSTTFSSQSPLILSSLSDHQVAFVRPPCTIHRKLSLSPISSLYHVTFFLADHRDIFGDTSFLSASLRR